MKHSFVPRTSAHGAKVRGCNTLRPTGKRDRATPVRFWMGCLLLWGTVACSADIEPAPGSANPSTTSQALERPAQTSKTKSSSARQFPKPKGADTIAPWLRARHPEDLPTGEDLRKIQGATEGLMWHARGGNPVFVRQRALMLLRHVPTAQARALLLESAHNLKLPHGLRAGAIRGLEGHLDPLQDDVRDLLQDTARHSDPRISYAAIKVMGSAPTLRKDLEDIAQDEEVDPKMRQEAQSLLNAP